MSDIDYSLLSTRYNTAPTQTVYVARSGEQQAELVPMQWKLVPVWSKTPTTKFNTFNARCETIDTSRVYRTPFRRHRCIVPAAGFYEWPKQGTSHFDDKKPYYIRLDQDQPLLFAGIWDRWHSDTQTIESCSIVTVPANATMADFHDRMPAMLDQDECSAWLDNEIEDLAMLKSLLVPWPEDDLECERVGKFVNNYRNEGPQCIEAE